MICRNLTSLLAGTALGLLCSPALAADRPGAGVEVASYSLALTPDIQNRTVAGREAITLRATVDGVRRLNFSANARAIDGATLDGVALAHTVKGDVLGFNLPQPLRRGRTVKLKLSYHGRPARGFAGSTTTLYTSYFACDWMVCSQNKFGENRREGDLLAWSACPARDTQPVCWQHDRAAPGTGRQRDP